MPEREIDIAQVRLLPNATAFFAKHNEEVVSIAISWDLPNPDWRARIEDGQELILYVRLKVPSGGVVVYQMRLHPTRWEWVKEG